MRFTLLILFTLLSLRANGATWYASASGSSTNGTTTNAPWGISYAFTNSANNPYLQPGDTVQILDGTFLCTESNATYVMGNAFLPRMSGTPGNPITYRSQNLWGAHFNGGLVINTSSNIILHGLRISSLLSTNRLQTNTAGFTYGGGINEDTEGNQILHCLIENVGHPGIGSWSTTRGKTIMGNIIRFCGIDDGIFLVGANRGSGMYLQNRDDSAEARIKGNISYFNYTTGMKAYGNQHVWKFTFQNNICADNYEAGIFYHLDSYASSNLSVLSNFTWRSGSGLKIGYQLGNGGHSNAVIRENTAVDDGVIGGENWPMSLVDGWSNVTVSNNTFVSLSNSYIFNLELSGETSGSTTSHKMGGNTYRSIGTNQFFLLEVAKTFTQWQADTGQDAGSTAATNLPTTLYASAFRPSDDSNFVHVAVYNWSLTNTLAVDLSGFGFSVGDTLNVYDAQNIPTAYKSEIYTGSPVSLDLTLTNRAVMLGTFTQRAETWTGFDSRFRAFVIHRASFGMSGNVPAIIGPVRAAGKSSSL